MTARRPSTCSARGDFDVVLSDISMPGMNGLELTRIARERDLDVPIVLVTGAPTVKSAIEALQHGAVEYLTKPVELPVLKRAIEKAARLHEMARMKREAMALLGSARARAGDRASLAASFDRALESLWMAYQPIVDAATGASSATRRSCARRSRPSRTRAPCSTPPSGSSASTSWGE